MLCCSWSARMPHSPVVSWRTSTARRRRFLRAPENVAVAVSRQRYSTNCLLCHQRPMLAPCAWDHDVLLRDWVVSRVLELVYTFPALAPWREIVAMMARPFPGTRPRRRWLHSELEAAYGLIYGLARPDVAFILETCMPGQPTQPSDAASSETLPALSSFSRSTMPCTRLERLASVSSRRSAPSPAAPHLGQERPQHMQRHSPEPARPSGRSSARLTNIKPVYHSSICMQWQVPLLRARK